MVFQSGWNFFAQQTEKGIRLIHRSEVQEKLSKLAVCILFLCTLSLSLLSTACGSVNANLAVATATLSDGSTISFQYCVVITDSALLSSGAEMNCFTDEAQANKLAVSIAATTDGAVTVIKKKTDSRPPTSEKTTTTTTSDKTTTTVDAKPATTK